MSFYVNELKKHAKEALDAESNIRNFLHVRIQKREKMSDLIVEIFEEGIVPVADKRGYKLTVEDEYGDSIPWKQIEDKKEMLKHSLEFSGYPMNRKYFFQTFYLAKEKRILLCYFELNGDPPESDIRVEFQYKDSCGQPHFIFGFRDFPESLYDTKGWEQFYSKREIFGRKLIPAENMTEELEKFMRAYDDIPLEILEKLITTKKI